MDLEGYAQRAPLPLRFLIGYFVDIRVAFCGGEAFMRADDKERVGWQSLSSGISFWEKAL